MDVSFKHACRSRVESGILRIVNNKQGSRVERKRECSLFCIQGKGMAACRAWIRHLSDPGIKRKRIGTGKESDVLDKLSDSL
jgi:hypothetical protein